MEGTLEQRKVRHVTLTYCFRGFHDCALSTFNMDLIMEQEICSAGLTCCTTRYKHQAMLRAWRHRVTMLGKGTEHAVVKFNLLGGQCSFNEYSTKYRARGTNQIALPELWNAESIQGEHLYNIAGYRMICYCFVNGDDVYIFSINYCVICY